MVHTAAREPPIVSMKGIVKRFPGVIANDHVDFDVRAGEIHALLGENGAGKTTLMNILYGIYQADEGRIYIRGKHVEIKSPRDAIRYGIGMVHQHFKLVYRHTVAENVALGFVKSFVNPIEEVRKKILEFSERYGLKVNPDARIWELSAGEQQRVEIIKALYGGAEVLILDEPTSVLTPSETRELFKTLKEMKAENKAIIFITHKLDEVFEVSDRVTVLRKGKVVSTLKTSDTNKRELARLMVGREVLFRLERRPVATGEVLLKVENLHVLNDRGLPAVKGVSFTLRAGEILGIAGVAGNGQRELVEAITGLRKVESGRIICLGKDVTNCNPRIIAMLGMAHIPEERIRLGIAPGLSVAENLILKSYHTKPFSGRVMLNWGIIRETAEKLVKEYEIMTPSINTPAKLLSGGNIQRLILARELSGGAWVIVAAHPTYGLDVGATEYIRKLLLKQRERGCGVLLVSEDLEEVLNLSDRIAVMFEGEFMGIVKPEEASIEDIGLMMAGTKRVEGESRSYMGEGDL